MIDKLVLTPEELMNVKNDTVAKNAERISDDFLEMMHQSEKLTAKVNDAISLATVKKVVRKLKDKTYGVDDGDGVLVH